MKLTHWKLGTVLLAVLILLCLVWWSGEEAPQPPHGAELKVAKTQTRQAVDPPDRPTSPQRRVPLEECEGCPSIPARNSVKRHRPGVQDDPYEIVDLVSDECQKALYKAAIDGDPNPDISGLGDCRGKTPLHVVMNEEQTRALLAAGGDPNARDDRGRTPLHVNGVRFHADGNTLEIINMLLEAGSDPTIEDNDGLAPWKYARGQGHAWIAHLRMHEAIAKGAEEQNLTMDAYLEMNPRFQAILNAIMDRYLIEAQVKKRLLDAAVGPGFMAEM